MGSVSGTSSTTPIFVSWRSRPCGSTIRAFASVLFDCLMIYRATVNYLRGKRIVAFLADDYPYSECGIPLRVVQRHGVPVYAVNFGASFSSTNS